MDVLCQAQPSQADLSNATALHYAATHGEARNKMHWSYASERERAAPNGGEDRKRLLSCEHAVAAMLPWLVKANGQQFCEGVLQGCTYTYIYIHTYIHAYILEVFCSSCLRTKLQELCAGLQEV